MARSVLIRSNISCRLAASSAKLGEPSGLLEPSAGFTGTSDFEENSDDDDFLEETAAEDVLAETVIFDEALCDDRRADDA